MYGAACMPPGGRGEIVLAWPRVQTRQRKSKPQTVSKVHVRGLTPEYFLRGDELTVPVPVHVPVPAPAPARPVVVTKIRALGGNGERRQVVRKRVPAKLSFSPSVIQVAGLTV